MFHVKRMLNMRLLALLVLGSVTLGGCSTNPQDFAGITRIYVQADENGHPMLRYTGGKEFQGFETTYRRDTDGSVSVTYKAEQIEAAAVVALRSEVLKVEAQEKWQTIREIAPDFFSFVCRLATLAGPIPGC